MRKPLDWILFPMVDSLPTPLRGVQASRACPTVAGTPETVKAAFTKESDVFAEHGIRYVSPFVAFADRLILEKQLFDYFRELLGLGREENERAVAEGWKALDAFDIDLKSRGHAILEELEREYRIGIVLLGRPYHNDPASTTTSSMSCRSRGSRS